MQHLVTITIDSAHPGPVVPDDFAGLSFERGPLGPGNAGVAGNLFTPENSSLVTLSRNLELGSLRIGGGTVDQLIPAGTGGDGFTGIDNLFAFAAVAGPTAFSAASPSTAPATPAGAARSAPASRSASRRAGRSRSSTTICSWADRNVTFNAFGISDRHGQHPAGRRHGHRPRELHLRRPGRREVLTRSTDLRRSVRRKAGLAPAFLFEFGGRGTAARCCQHGQRINTVDGRNSTLEFSRPFFLRSELTMASGAPAKRAKMRGPRARN